jgi:hypothetical protein
MAEEGNKQIRVGAWKVDLLEAAGARTGRKEILEVRTRDRGGSGAAGGGRRLWSWSTGSVVSSLCGSRVTEKRRRGRRGLGKEKVNRYHLPMGKFHKKLKVTAAEAGVDLLLQIHFQKQAALENQLRKLFVLVSV